VKNDVFLILSLKKIFIFHLLFFFSLASYSQLNSNFREKQIVLSSDSLIVDSLSIIPNSLFLFDSNTQLVSDNKYQINYFSSLLIFDSAFVAQHKNIKFKIQYRIFSTALNITYFHRDTFLIVNPLFERKKNYNNFISNNQSFLFDDDLKKEGSISREIALGNKQDLVLNSNFNLQLSGKLTSDISIIASISENNIPFQADGNTQQLQEFDKIFIQISNVNQKLTVGDFEIFSPEGYFLKLNKKVKGVSFEIIEKYKTYHLKNAFSASISKGTYHRVKIQGIENNQGPYRLYGIYNELFIIVLSGSEKVFLNGKLLSRGSEFDYTIDYNKAEIQFNNTVPITKDSRIIIEFEYSEQNYARFNFFTSNEFSTTHAKYGFNFYSESDSKTQTINQELSENEKLFLSEIGNNLENAFVENVEKVDFDANFILYKMQDTLVADKIYSPIYIYTTSADTTNYKLGFTFVGTNKGNYVRENSIANGKIYKWIAPVNNLPQGDYEPIKLLITPKKKQMLTFWAKNNFGNKLSSDIEIALTNSDLNTFSSIGNSETKGVAFSGSISFPSEKYLIRIKQLDSIAQKDSLFVGKREKKKPYFFSTLKYQFVQMNFSALENFREAEFARNWNFLQQPKGNESSLNLQLNYVKTDSNLFVYNIDYYNISTEYKAIKNTVLARTKNKNFRSFFTGSYLYTQSTAYESNFIRYNSEIERLNNTHTLGITHNLEYNVWKKKQTDSLLNNSYSFFEFDFFIKNKLESKNKWQIVYQFRNDFLPYLNSLKNNSLSQDLNFNVKFLQNKSNVFKTSFIFRKLEIKDTLDLTIEPQNSFRVQLEHALKLRKNFLITSLLYENFTGLELQREYSYFEVNQGQGNYVWKDYNLNTIKELDEFEISNFQYDANYIRVWLPSSNYQKVYGNKFNFSVKLEPNRIWNKKNGIKKVFSNFSDYFSYSAEQKTDVQDFIPYLFNDESLDYFQTLNFSARNIFSFNKSKRVFNFDHVFTNNKVFLMSANGFDFSENRGSEFKFKLLFLKTFTFSNDFLLGKKKNFSEYLIIRNYSIDIKKFSSILSYQYDRKYKFDFSFSITEKKNTLGFEQSFENKFSGKIAYSIASKSNLNISTDFIKIKFNSESVNSLTYTMLEGLYPGNNVIWNITFLKNISKTLQLNFNYSGRTNKSEKIIHNGSVQIKALF